MELPNGMMGYKYFDSNQQAGYAALVKAEYISSYVEFYKVVIVKICKFRDYFLILFYRWMQDGWMSDTKSIETIRDVLETDHRM